MIKVHEAQGPGPSPATRRRAVPEEVTMHQPPIPHVESEDPEVADLIHAEARRQFEKIRLIPSENYVSTAVLEASGSVLTNK
jgi:glycine hydroxymethyltransferase